MEWTSQFGNKIKLILARNGLLNVVNGIEIDVRPTYATCHQIWLQKNSIAKSYISLNLGDNSEAP
jgi:hypothetical protein